MIIKRLQGEQCAAVFEMDKRVAALRHPNLVPIFDAREVALCDLFENHVGTPRTLTARCIVMPEAQGDVSSMLRPHRGVGWPLAGYIVMDVLAGLSELHLAGLIHRDVKPANVLYFTDDWQAHAATRRYTLCDFSLCAPLGEELKTWELRDMLAGTGAYMAPEQCEKEWKNFGPWTDIYGVGCLLWSLLTGQPLWKGADRAGLLHNQVHCSLPTAFPNGRPYYADDVEHWIARCTAKAPGARFQTAGEAAMALLPLLTTPERITQKTPTGYSVSRGEPTEAETAHKRPRIYLTSAETAAPGPMHPALPPDGTEGLTLSVERVPDPVARDLIVGNVLALMPSKGNGYPAARLEAYLRRGAFLPGHLRCGESVPAMRMHINATRRAGGKRWVSVPSTAKAQQWDGAWWLYDGVVPPDSLLLCGCLGGRHHCHLPMIAPALAASGWDVVMDGVPVAMPPPPRAECIDGVWCVVDASSNVLRRIGQGRLCMELAEDYAAGRR